MAGPVFCLALIPAVCGAPAAVIPSCFQTTRTLKLIIFRIMMGLRPLSAEKLPTAPSG